MTALELALVGAAVFAAAFTQVLSGFGFALLSVPLMTLAVPTRQAVVISMLVGLVATTRQAWAMRADVDRSLVTRITAGAYLGMPLGLLVFVTVDDDTLRLVLGIAVLVAVVLLLLRVDLRGAGPGLDVGAGFVSGVLNTSLSTNGPPLVFTLQARRLEPDRFRATLAAAFALSSVVGVALFVAAGEVNRDGLVGAAVALPAMLAGQLAGFPVRRHVHGERFRVLVLVLLVAAAVSAIANAVA